MNKFHISNDIYFINVLKGDTHNNIHPIRWMWSELTTKEKEHIKDEYPELLLKYMDKII